MENKITQEDLEVLQRADSRLPSYMYSLGVHFAQIIANSHQNGLLYVARHTQSKSILPISGIEIDKEGNVTLSTLPTWDGKTRKFVVGSPDFLENALADAYIGGDCGCQFPSDNPLEHFRPLESLLPYGHVFYNILADGCGESFQKRTDEFTGMPFQDTFLQAHRWSPNPIVKHYSKIRNLPKGLSERLHIITTLSGEK